MKEGAHEPADALLMVFNFVNRMPDYRTTIIFSVFTALPASIRRK